MAHPREVDVARRRFLRDGSPGGHPGVVRPVVLASWERARAAGVDTGRLAAPLLVPHAEVRAAADRVVDRVHARHPELDASVLVVDRGGVVLARRDGDTALAELLDALGLVPGRCHAEHVVGTTAAALAFGEGEAVAVEGPEHLHPELAVLAAAAAPVDPDGGDLAVVVVRHAADGAVRDLPFVRMLAREVADGDGARRRGRVLAVHDALAAGVADEAPWVLATDGEDVVLGPGVRRLPPADQQALADIALAGLALEQPAEPHHVDLPSGTCAQVSAREIRHDDRLLGCVVRAGPAVDERGRREAEARRRQGSHVAPTARRDFAADLRGESSAAARAHAAARVRANRDLLTPSLRARQELAANLGQRRHQVLVGEAGVGKRTLAVEQFQRLCRDGAVTIVDPEASDDGLRAAEQLARLVRRPPSRPHLVVLRGLQGVAPLSARRLDEQLRLVLTRATNAVVVACLDTTSVDTSRPYGLLLRHFHETVRVPALRHRADELADIALSVLSSLSGGRSLRLSHQVIRVLEGYAWPGNINELEDVLRYVVARKPVGIVQAPDLPALCFTRRAPRLSMLETAQADAIIQALYEARGNRYQAAAMLGIARSSLYRKIDAFGISYIA